MKKKLMKYYAKRAIEIFCMLCLGVSTAVNVECMIAIAKGHDITFACVNKEEELK